MKNIFILMNNWFLQFLLLLLMVTYGPFTVSAFSLSDNQVVIYDMKDDPTLSQFVGHKTPGGFYCLEIDELRGSASVLYRLNEQVLRVDVDLKLKDEQLILKNGKRKKIYVRELEKLATGGNREIVYPIECPPSKNGWRYGSSYGRHIVRRDDMDRHIIVSSAQLEFELTQKRCEGPFGDCGPIGCDQAEIVDSSASIKAIPVRPVQMPSPVQVSLSRALLEGKLSEQEIITTYKGDLDTILPPIVNDLTVLSTGYHTTAFPYPGISDPFIEKKGLKIGVVTKRYLLEDKITPLVVEIEPLLEEYRAPAANKCGTWESGANKIFFDIRGQPALYIQTPAASNIPGSSSLYICGKTISISIQTQVVRSQDSLMLFYNALPIDQIERLVGSDK